MEQFKPLYLQWHLQWELMFQTSILFYTGNLECYVQEIGRGGRNGDATNAILYYTKMDLRHTNESMRNYCIINNMQCRRVMLMMPFSEDGVVEKPKVL